MNIFVLDRDPQLAARSLSDQHVVKMIVESAQILSTALHRYGVPAPYKATHRTHKTVQWAGNSRSNYDWLLAHLEALGQEYTRRYGKTHGTMQHFPFLYTQRQAIPAGPLTEFVQEVGPYQDNDPVRAYRTYYIREKAPKARYYHCPPPSWLMPHLNPEKIRS